MPDLTTRTEPPTAVVVQPGTITPGRARGAGPLRREGPAKLTGAARHDDRPATPHLDTLQAAFLETGGAQCGICTPGMLMAARAYLDAGGGPDDDAIREAIAGNLCRCTGYTKIIEAIPLGATREPTRSAGATL